MGTELPLKRYCIPVLERQRGTPVHSELLAPYATAASRGSAGTAAPRYKDITDRLVYTILSMVLLEQEGLLDKSMLERMQRPLIMALETSEDITIMGEVMA